MSVAMRGNTPQTQGCFQVHRRAGRLGGGPASEFAWLIVHRNDCHEETGGYNSLVSCGGGVGFGWGFGCGAGCGAACGFGLSTVTTSGAGGDGGGGAVCMQDHNVKH